MPAIPVIAVAATVASTAYAAYSADQQGKAQERLANYNATMAEQDAMVAERDARIAANEKRREDEYFKSRQRALYAKAGVVSTTGSPLLVQAETAGTIERNAMGIEVAGSNQGRALRNESVMQRFAGASARRAGTMNAIGHGLQGASSVAQQSYQYWGGKDKGKEKGK